eukprot:CAMPEP_0194214954 /NCGR_PEP_ID=MMETSP0156-20130528/16397_1 /TAXON_ID=33649 /ORGANISM="Thalassionema nitzschioides, Strain L26-B" /LENGTH=245 /DNA_ID=CAMNT_0038943333 /DNA_START=175 /DNA_END=912 /DNA_ORIENTATION=+
MPITSRAPPVMSRSLVRLFDQPNRLAEVYKLKNDFFVLRHGQSEANVERVISSDPATDSYGLTNIGKMQGKQAAKEICELCNNYKSYSGICILTSNFQRAVETACFVESAAKYHAYCPVQGSAGGGAKNEATFLPDDRLRERGFGSFDGTSDANYARVWDEDLKDSSHEIEGVESVDSVMARITELVQACEAQWTNHLVVLVGHHDVLQILQVACFKEPGTEHRRVQALATGEVRALDLVLGRPN